MSTSILGMNARNLSYIREKNSRQQIRLADDKLATKKILKEAGIRTPRLFGSIGDIRELEEFNWDKLPVNFVIKPNQGFGGGGIAVLRIKGKKTDSQKKAIKDREWLDTSGQIWTFRDLRQHILNILDGNYSLSGSPDVAMIERKIMADKIFKEYAVGGVPDIRVVVYNNVPVMAMLRLPTNRSRGRANITQGAVAVGIDIGSGQTTTATVKMPWRKMIERHPDTKKELRGFKIPLWNEILEMSIEVQKVTGLGFVGVDLTIDNRYGAEVIEINARPGLEIQVANREGLAKRLERVDGLRINTVKKGVRVAKELFGGEIEERVEEVTGREVLGVVERVRIIRENERPVQVLAKVDTGADSSSISERLAKKIGFGSLVGALDGYQVEGMISEREAKKMKKKIEKDVLLNFSEMSEVTFVFSSHGVSFRPVVRLSLIVSGVKLVSRVNITKRLGLKYQMIIGRRDMKGFFVDPEKTRR